MDLIQLKWIKNVKHQVSDKKWAYKYHNNNENKPILKDENFELNWRSSRDKNNAQKPNKGDLMLLLQRAKVTHVVEFLDDKVYEYDRNEWSIHRKVKVIWIPPKKFLSKEFPWENLPHQREYFGYDYIVGDGQAHNLADNNGMLKFNQHWNKQGGLLAFQKHVDDILKKYRE